jgi:hypothetical protein
MSSDALLAHLAARFVTQRENLATEALLHVLNRSDHARDAFIRTFSMLGADLPSNLAFRTQAACKEGIPDLVGVDSTGGQCLVVEAKFWAALTDNQPVGYLRPIAEQGHGTLAFLVPERRLEIVWHELLKRCREAGLRLAVQEHTPGRVRIAAVEPNTTLLIVSWSEVLGNVFAAVQRAGEQDVASDLRQLQALCAREDADAFLPLTSEELTSSVPGRVVQFCDLVDDLTANLVNRGSADVTRLRAVGGRGWYGKYLRLNGFGCLLHFSADKWAAKAFTPIWLRVTGKDWEPSQAIAEHLAPRLVETGIRPYSSPTGYQIPIMLPTLVERDAVLGAAMRQLIVISEWLAELEVSGSQGIEADTAPIAEDDLLETAP